VVEALVTNGRAVNSGLRWAVRSQGADTYPTDLYAGQAGVLAFLAEAYRVRPDAALRETLEKGGAALRAAPRGSSPSLFSGSAGPAWAFLSLHEALGGTSPTWLDAALERAPAIAAASCGLIGDLINGTPGQGVFLLRLAEVSGDRQWIDAAARLADRMLERAVPAGDGIMIPSFAQPDGQFVAYTGLSHGSAGAAYFLCRLAQSLPASQRAAYAEPAEAVAAWLDGITWFNGDSVNWYRRQPDQLTQYQATWCHGAPGIGLFYAELNRLTNSPSHLEMAQRCAATTESSTQSLACQCHGIVGNAQLYLKLFRQTGQVAWLDKVRTAGDAAWSRRLVGTRLPAWIAGDGSSGDNPGLMTGTAGVGWFYLQLALDGALEGPVTA
jgi:lantibiotic biosynthesis protein